MVLVLIGGNMGGEMARTNKKTDQNLDDTASVAEIREVLDSVNAKMADMLRQNADLAARVQQLEETHPEHRRLSAAAVRAMLEVNPNTMFEVLVDYKHGSGLAFPAGAEFNAALYPRIVDHVGQGLMLAIPRDHDVVLARKRAEAEAQLDAAQRWAAHQLAAQQEAAERFKNASDPTQIGH